MDGRNEQIKKYAKDNGVYQYEIADALNISEMTLFRRMRHILSHEQENEIKNAIDRIVAERNEK